MGGAKPLTVHNPKSYVGSDLEDQQFEGVPDFYARWPELDIVGWEGGSPADFAKERDAGGVWSGGELELDAGLFLTSPDCSLWVQR